MTQTARFITFAAAAMALCAAAPGSFAGAAAPAAPPAEYIDRGACPFECCVYREWKTNREVTLMDAPRGKRVIVVIPAGRAVTGVTGEVISRPARWVARRDLETQNPDADTVTPPIRKGEAYYILHYAGEGYWTVWHQGRVVIASLDPPDGAPADGGDKSVWWVQIRTADGKTGWAISTDNFDNQDSCG